MEPVLQCYTHFFGATPAKLVMDVGTRDGDDAQFFNERLNPELVVAIDANPVAAELTRKRYPDFVVLETAVSDYNGTTTFTQIVTDDTGLAGSSSIDAEKLRTVPDYAKRNVIEVPVSRLDTLLKTNKIPTKVIDIMKVDVEGFTYQCLSGMGDLLRNVRVLHLETERAPTHVMHVSNLGVARFMRANGFVLVGLYYEYGWGIQDQLWVNAKFVKDQEYLASIALSESDS